ncbi:spore germination protein [Alkalihalobacterium alkalinitrilicum]|uniref:spore germination protein n=1 Tax=Alkalihalobacterium alkalinitrilicum TaxID=427920 RepID=UPI001C571FC0|nr:spore germination protein [Alkalihalobacterium alkalinitrilicum]
MKRKIIRPRQDPNNHFKEENFYAEAADYIKDVFTYPKNKDLISRNVSLKGINKTATLFFVNGMVNYDEVQQYIIKALQQMDKERYEGEDLHQYLIKNVLSVKEAQMVTEPKELVEVLINGQTLMFVEDMNCGIAIATTSFEHRGIEHPQTENVIKGPMEGFTESASVNRSLIRKQLKSEDLVTEEITVGKKAISRVSVMYIKSLVNEELLENVRDRIEQIEVDAVQGLAILEQYIEERPYSLLPTTLYTERPDRGTAFLNEGHIVILMDNSPACLVVPITFWGLFHTAEDYYHRWAFGNFIRIIRLLSFFIALLTPSLYIAISNFHIEMFPTDLLLAISATRERVPFPAIVEVIMMELSFELIREAGVRIPTPIGPTIGIVGALILGQAAVEAGIISPILVIIVAITGLASFAIPDMSMNFTVRISRFICLFFAATLGFFGISIFLVFAITYANHAKSFGVPFFSPMAPHTRSSKDMLVRPPVWKLWLRPFYVFPKEKVRGSEPRGR